jgi:hypothetical protein
MGSKNKKCVFHSLVDIFEVRNTITQKAKSQWKKQLMCKLRNSHYGMVFIKWRVLIGLEAVSKSYSCIKNGCTVFTTVLYLVEIMYPFMILRVISLLAFICVVIDKLLLCIFRAFYN